ncbi:hypothetical protein [Sphingomonas sp.]|jgi:hypothetical protein|uniref:hypothetical protein n=1 Tax=Sphingomonas sp. TaxID=28214 RepID=UPI0026177D52|nr:hypothetical protein [Sphingomonas sp.]MDF2605718.1 PpiC-type peptidyl-prolyl cis-trans isomerase [Sphingomonas sp.]
MPTLGDTLAAARRSSAGLEQWLRRTDPALAHEAAAAAARIGISVSGYARMAIANFTRLAGEEDWATLMSGLRDSQDPGTTCLAAMVHWRLTAPACRAHSNTQEAGITAGGTHG